MSRRGDRLQNKGVRGNRRAAAQRAEAPAVRTRLSRDGNGGGDGEPPARWRVWLKRGVITGVVLGLLGVIFVGVAVGFAARSIPSFGELQATQPGQTIIVRARDGREIVELGPSFGDWLDAGEIPDTMKNAMVAVEEIFNEVKYHSDTQPLFWNKVKTEIEKL